MNCLEKIAESPINKMFVSLQYERYKKRYFKFKKTPKTPIYRYLSRFSPPIH